MVQNVEPQEALFIPVQGATNVLPWRYLATSEHQAALLDAVGQVTRQLTFGVDFTIAPEGDTAANMGEITLLAAPTAAETQLRVRGDAAAVQPVPPEPGTAAIIGALDRLAIVVQQVEAGVERVEVPAEFEASQAAAAAASAAAEAAAISAALAATFEPANFQPADASLDTLSGQVVAAKGLELLAAAGGSDIRTAAALGSVATRNFTDNPDLTVQPEHIAKRGDVDANLAALFGTRIDETLNRAEDTSYTNNFGRPIAVLIQFQTNLVVNLLIDGEDDLVFNAIDGGPAPVITLCAIIPNGATYEFTGIAPQKWVEYR